MVRSYSVAALVLTIKRRQTNMPVIGSYFPCILLSTRTNVY